MSTKTVKIAGAGVGPTASVFVPYKSVRRFATIAGADVSGTATITGALQAVTDPIKVEDVAKIHLYIRYEAGAAGGGYLVLPEFNAGDTNDWVPASTNTPVSSYSSPTTALNPAFDGQNVKYVEAAPVAFVSPASVGTDLIAAVVSVNVEAATHVRFLLGDIGATPGSLTLEYVLST